jgi:hypothetical protein
MKISDHIIGLGVAIPITLILLISLKGIVTGGMQVDLSRFEIDEQPAIANPETTNR